MSKGEFGKLIHINKDEVVVSSESIARQLAEQHWQFLERWLHMVYVDTFVHGFGHGGEDERDKKGEE